MNKKLFPMSGLGRARFLAGVAVGAAVTSLVLGGFVVASVVSTSETVTACVSTSNGSVRIIDPSQGQNCKRSENQLTWNQEGAPGAPGPQGESGAPGAPGAPGDSVLDDLCSNDSYVLAWNDTLEEWGCRPDADTLGSLECEAGQSVGFNGESWECRNAPILGTLTDTAWGLPGPCCGVDDMFDARSPNIDNSTFCEIYFCEIRLVDVVDHTTCQVIVSGNSRSDQVDVFLFPDGIDVFLFGIALGEPLYINISCAS